MDKTSKLPLETITEFRRIPGDRKGTTVLKLKDVHLYGVVSGEIPLDVDGWLDRLMGSKLDDAEVTALVLCRYEGEFLGLALGYTREHRGRSGALNLREDGIVFPLTSEIKTISRKMRARAERLMTSRPVQAAALAAEPAVIGGS